MYNNQENLQALAKMARQQLEEQSVEKEIDTEEVNPGEDLYAEFRNEYDEETDIDYVKTDINRNYIEPQPKLKDYPYDEPEYEIEREANELYPGGPTKDMLDAWKKQFKDHGIFLATVSDENYIFRTLNRTEYKQIVATDNTNALQREDIICQECVLWPNNFTWAEIALKKAGIPSALASIIMEKSGFTKEYTIEVL